MKKREPIQLIQWQTLGNFGSRDFLNLRWHLGHIRGDYNLNESNDLFSAMMKLRAVTTCSGLLT